MAFKKGESGNPKGRPKGVTDATLIRKAVAGAVPSIIRMLVDAAQGGDISAAKILLDRVCPVLKAQSVSIDLPATGTLVKQGERVLKATLTGAIPADIGAQLLAALSNQGRLIESQELEERIAALEERK